MDRKLGGLILAAFAGPAAATGDAPFCIYSSGPPQCFYYSVDACQSAARTLGGMCAPNNSAPQQQIQVQPSAPQMQYPDISGSFQRGQQMRQQQEEHAARMAAMDAEIARMQQAPPPPIAAPATAAITEFFVCPSEKAEGGTYLNIENDPGCLRLPAWLNPF